uniref:Putative molybdopterin oxidoreductase. Similar to molybdopterin containing oxidoreductase (FdhA, nuoG, napA) n=1 Tax=Magnetococcus massalia (strain MO-1) TaxID=451514 RepID=A0A1S7LKW0_MAGMO|nr:Putative molybdopterin oxidoreductase. Similar to molybdopterin containing oxidoreductase (FdhA, nuoG, napA) [Candidatus Magnetococcus massalia]
MSDKTPQNISISIDGQTLHLPPGSRLLAAAKRLGKTIPTLCHSERLKPAGNCRICLVEQQGRGLVPACATEVEEGGVYTTASARVTEVRRQNMAMILRDHPLQCSGCVADSQCRLQEVAMDLGFTPESSPRSSPAPLDDRHPIIHIDPSLCIQCALCVRACDEIQGQNVLGFAGRGDRMVLTAGLDRGLESSGCVSCGQCLFECPTGALQLAGEGARGKPDRRISTVCGYCAVGCKLHVAVKGNRVQAITPDPNGSANRGHACVKGRFGHAFLQAEDRITTPLIRQVDGQFKPASWDEALDLVAARFQSILNSSGARSLGVVSSARCTNEENYLLQKFSRVVFGSNNVDNCARVCHSPSAFALGEALGTGASTSSFQDVEKSDLLMLVGANPTEAHPVLGARIKQAVRRGCKLIVIDPRNTELARMADIHIPLPPGSNVAVINALQQTLMAENLLDQPFIARHTEGFEALQGMIHHYTPAWVEQETGVAAELLQRAARLYASVDRAQILWGLGITESCQGSVSAFGLINLALMTGNLGRPGTGSSPIRGQNNVQGACDMGALPNVFSDYQSVSDGEVRARHQSVWGALPPEDPGLKLPQMLADARAGRMQGIYIVAQDPAQSDPETEKVRQALESLEFLVVQELFMTETARFADVVLPGAGFLEKSGSFVNSDRRIQRVCKAVEPPGEAWEDGRITHEIAKRMGIDLGFGEEGGINPSRVMDEIATLSPNWGGVNYARLEAEGFVQWPCTDAAHPGTEIVHRDGAFVRGRGRFTPTPWRPPVEATDTEYPFMLTTGRILYHYNVGTMTRRTPIGQLNAAKQETLRIHPEDAARLKMRDGERVRVISSYGALELPLELSKQTNPGLLFMAFHFSETLTNLLIGDQSDDQTLCPEYKVTTVRLEPVGYRGSKPCLHEV